MLLIMFYKIFRPMDLTKISFITPLKETTLLTLKEKRERNRSRGR